MIYTWRDIQGRNRPIKRFMIRTKFGMARIPTRFRSQRANETTYGEQAPNRYQIEDKPVSVTEVTDSSATAQLKKQAMQSTSGLRGVPERYHGSAKPMDKLKVLDLIAKTRALEERLVCISKTEHGYFWVGGPGEEAFNIPLGLLVHKGEGLDHDYLHLHYRSAGILVAMGMDIMDTVRQMCSKATDPYSGGRNFVSHFAIKKWNVLPVSSTIETQYSVAPGTALAQKRHGGNAITIVNGGDAGTAEADFHTCLNWSSRPGVELPILILVVNNGYGISTPFNKMYGNRIVVQQAEPFGIRWDTVDGNDAVASWTLLSEAMNYVREERKPFVIEARTARLHGHSSSSGGRRIEDEPDCLKLFTEQLIEEKLITQQEVNDIYKTYQQEAFEAFQQVIHEPEPSSDSITKYIFV